MLIYMFCFPHLYFYVLYCTIQYNIVFYSTIQYIILQECINYIGDHFQHLYNSAEDLKHLPVDLFAKCIKSDR